MLFRSEEPADLGGQVSGSRANKMAWKMQQAHPGLGIKKDRKSVV